MSKSIQFNKDALDGMLRGMKKVHRAVNGTYGPCGTNVFLDDPVSPKFTNDGHSIAHRIELSDKLENAGAWVVRNACAQTNDDAGDGTTTVSVLLEAIIEESLARPENKTLVMQSLMEAKEKVLVSIKKLAKPITQKEVISVARISAENEPLAQLITEVVGKVGAKATIAIEDRIDGFESDYKLMQGYEAHVGFESPYFINQKGKALVVHEDIAVLCVQKRMGTINDLKMFEQFEKEKINRLVIVAQEIDEQIKGIFAATHVSRKMELLVIKAQGSLLEDIAAATGAHMISDETGITFENFDAKKHLGHATKVICEEKKTVFISGASSAAKHGNRLLSLAESNTNGFEKKKLRERAAKLKGGIAVIRIGAHTDAERNYLRDKADDTVHSVQSALEEGVVEGGGIALYRVAGASKGKTPGEEILSRALTAPLRQIVANAGKDYAEIIKNLPDGQGYDARKDRYCDFFKEGILDPFKVERCAVENAVSTAAHFISMHCSIVEAQDEK